MCFGFVLCSLVFNIMEMAIVMDPQVILYGRGYGVNVGRGYGVTRVGIELLGQLNISVA